MHHHYPTYQWQHWQETSVVGTYHLYWDTSRLVLEQVVECQESWMFWQVQCVCYEYGWGMATPKQCWGWDGLLKLLQEYSSEYMWGVCDWQVFPLLAYLCVESTDWCQHVNLNGVIKLLMAFKRLPWNTPSYSPQVPCWQVGRSYPPPPLWLCNFDRRIPGWLIIDMGGWELSSGECKENSKPEK